jgi:hypothetical protein
MVAEQARCPIEVAISKLSDRADATSRSVADAARLVMAGVLRFDSN